ncbi:glycosyltransferase family 4 protein [Henriciella pelagia]|uniref:glycosyltransferase family 4 protein n=1 Tax=Henriciella pelagia TaxID=1977912 RepID=UPI00351802DC
MTILVSIALVGLSFVASYILCEATKRTGVVDAPDGQRKLQDRPIPRLGGVGILAAVALVMLVAGVVHTLAPRWLGSDWLPGGVPDVWFALGLTFLFGAVGAADDIFDLNPVVKLALLLALCVLAPFVGVAATELASPFGTVTLPAILIAGSATWLLVFINASNFMDGSNGLSLGSLAFMLAGLGVSLMLSGRGGFPLGLACIIATIGGFLIHNLRGELYAGDAGAFGVGAIFATFGLISGLPVWTIATLALPLLIDVLLTLVSRTRRGQPLFTAHRDHAYQSLIKAGWSHIEVAMVWWGLSAACGIAAAVGAVGGGALPFILFWVFAALFSGGWLFIHRQAGQEVPGHADR